LNFKYNVCSQAKIGMGREFNCNDNGLSDVNVMHGVRDEYGNVIKNKSVDGEYGYDNNCDNYNEG